MTTNDNPLDEIDFWAFTVAFGPENLIVDGVEKQLSKWWKGGIADCPNAADLAPLRLPKEYNPRSRLVALYELQSPSSAIMIESNLNDGYSSLSRMLSRNLPNTRFIVVRSKPVGRSEWPIEEFGLMQESKGGYIRHVWVALDTSGWKAGDSGELQDFEEPEYYKKRWKRDRLTRGQIVRYLGRLGVDVGSLADPDGYRLIRCFTDKFRSE